MCIGGAGQGRSGRWKTGCCWRGVKASDRGGEQGVVLAGEVRKLVAHPLDHGWLAIIILAFGLLRMLRSNKLTLRLRAQHAWKVMEVNELREPRSSVGPF